jgi:hypothetical protein
MNCLPGLTSNCDPLDLSLQVARITGVSRWCPVKDGYFSCAFLPSSQHDFGGEGLVYVYISLSLQVDKNRFISKQKRHNWKVPGNFEESNIG